MSARPSAAILIRLRPRRSTRATTSPRCILRLRRRCSLARRPAMRSTCAASSACTRRFTWTSTTAAVWRRQGRLSGCTPCCCSRATEYCASSRTCRRQPGRLASSASARTCYTHRWVVLCRIGTLRVGGTCLYRVGAFLVTANYSAGAVESPVLVQSEAAQHCTMEVRLHSLDSSRASRRRAPTSLQS